MFVKNTVSKYYNKKNISRTIPIEDEVLTSIDIETLSNTIRYLEKNHPLILDNGCGFGRLALPLALLGYSVVAIDFSKNAIMRFKQALLDRGLNVSLIVADAENLPFIPSAFDLVYSFGAFEYFSSSMLDNALKETQRVLRKNGATIFEVYNTSGLLYKLKFAKSSLYDETQIIPLNSYSKQEILKKLKDAQFDYSEIQGYQLKRGCLYYFTKTFKATSHHLIYKFIAIVCEAVESSALNNFICKSLIIFAKEGNATGKNRN